MRLKAALALCLASLALAWCAGFAWFAVTAGRPAATVPVSDGIVVLTGGAGRIEAALDLLQADRARLMLISGVSANLDLDAIARAAGRRVPDALRDRIALGHGAESTVGNARETAGWAHANGLHVLIVVTAGYHMRRALAEIGTALPAAELHADPVMPPAMNRPGLGRLRLLAEEYSKWLVVALGLTRSAHLREIA